MKKFSQFLTEASESQATLQAKRLGLVKDGHGGWYDRTGEFAAKTVGGKLKFYNQNQVVGKQDPPQRRTTLNPQISATLPAPKSSEQVEPKAPAEQAPKIEDKGTLTVVFGRFNPPTSGHQKLFDKAFRVAEKGKLKIYPSRTQDPKRNPLDPDTKISMMRKMFPKYSERIVNDEHISTIFDVLQKASDQGYSGINIVVGADRQKEFEKLATQYNGDLYNFAQMTVVSVGKTDPDNDKTSSSSLLRKAAAENDYETFLSGIPKSVDNRVAKKMFRDLQKSMNLEENWELWEIAPKFDYEGLRENYIRGNIFKVGQIIENLNTGMVGKIIRRGTNYLICVTEDDMMFKPWIKDVKEWTDTSGVPANQREIGTDALRRYVMKMTGTKKIKNFINTNRKNNLKNKNVFK